MVGQPRDSDGPARSAGLWSPRHLALRCTAQEQAQEEEEQVIWITLPGAVRRLDLRTGQSHTRTPLSIYAIYRSVYQSMLMLSFVEFAVLCVVR